MAASKGKGVNDAKATKAAKTTRINLHVSREASKRLSIHSVMSGDSAGAIVERLIEAHLRTWKVQVNSPAGIDRPAPVAESSPAILAAAG